MLHLNVEQTIVYHPLEDLILTDRCSNGNLRLAQATPIDWWQAFWFLMTWWWIRQSSIHLAGQFWGCQDDAIRCVPPYLSNTELSASARTLLGAKGIATRRKDVTRGSWPFYERSDRTLRMELLGSDAYDTALFRTEPSPPDRARDVRLDKNRSTRLCCACRAMDAMAWEAQGTWLHWSHPPVPRFLDPENAKRIHMHSSSPSWGFCGPGPLESSPILVKLNPSILGAVSACHKWPSPPCLRPLRRPGRADRWWGSSEGLGAPCVSTRTTLGASGHEALADHRERMWIFQLLWSIMFCSCHIVLIFIYYRMIRIRMIRLFKRFVYVFVIVCSCITQGSARKTSAILRWEPAPS